MVTTDVPEPTPERRTSEVEATNGALWTAHRRRAEALRERYPHAAQPLTLYLALLDVWEDGWRLARADGALLAGSAGGPDPYGVAAWAAEKVGPGVLKATEAAGPEALATATRELADALEPVLAVWLAGQDQPPVERYLARACLYPVLVALEADAGPACADPSPRDERHCPRCGGPPQLSWRDASGEALVSARRQLLCARCGHDWAYSNSACPACGETTGSKRTVYAERRGGPVVASAEPESPPADGLLPHLRIEACATCSTYVIDVDRGREPRAVPEVDELVALPLDLYAGEHGLTKITPNLMGF
jgi:FdhE protein